MFGNSFQTSEFEASYFNIDDILTTHERVLCKFELPVLNMGALSMISNIDF